MVKALVIADGKVEVRNISTELEDLQQLVGGYLEVFNAPFLGYTLICDEEGKLKGKGNTLLPIGGPLCSVDFVGTVVVVGCSRNNPDFQDVPEHIVENISTYFYVY